MRIFALSSLALLSSCTLGPNFSLPSFESGATWKSTQAKQDAQLPDQWWLLFHDSNLNHLVQQALSYNQDLAAARSRVETSRALVGIDRARFFPTLNLNSSASRSKLSQESLANNLPPSIDLDLTIPRYRSTLEMAFDPDLWGKNKRRLEATDAQTAAAEASLDSLRLGVATTVAQQYFLLIGLTHQEQILNRTIATRERTLQLLNSKTQAGLTDGLASNQANTEFELAKHDLAQIQRQRGATENALAVLCGARPNQFHIRTTADFPSLPRIQPGLPAQVLNRRPDIRANQQLVRAANAQIGVAEANFYPNFALTTSGGFESITPANFLDWQNRVLSIGISAAAPIFDGGTNRANYDAALSRRNEALATYRNSLLVALREVEDAITDIQGLSSSQTALTHALQSAQNGQKIAKERFEKGLTSYLEVIEADRTILRIELVLSQIQSQQRISYALLAKSLGGGWSPKKH